MSFEPLTWNANQRRLSGERAVTRFGVGHWNFRKLRSSVWQPIRAEISPDLTATQFAASVQFAKSSQDWSRLLFDGGFSIRRYLDERNGDNPEPEFGLDLAVETQHNVSGEVDELRPSQVVYRGAWDSADLRLGIWHGRAARVEKVVEIHSEPSGDDEFVKYSFLLRSSTAKIWTGRKFDVRPWAGRPADKVELHGDRVFIARLDSQLRGALLREPVAWYYRADGTMVRRNIRVTFEILGDAETVRATKWIPRRLIREARAAGDTLKTDATLTPDANPETAGVDGYAGASGQNSNWATITSASGTTASDSGSWYQLWMSSNGTSGNYDVLFRNFFFFDTSSLDGSVSAAEFRFTTHNSVSDTGVWSSDINVFGSTSSGTTSLAAADFQTAQTTPFADSGVAAPQSTETQYGLTLNADGKAAIDVDGYSRFALALGSYDLGQGTPTWSANKDQIVRLKFAELQADATELEVTTGAVGGGAGSRGGVSAISAISGRQT